MSYTPTQLRVLLVERGIKQIDIAVKLNLDETLLSRYLNGRREWPEGFESQFLEAVDQVAAEKSAQLRGEDAPTPVAA